MIARRGVRPLPATLLVPVYTGSVLRRRAAALPGVQAAKESSIWKAAAVLAISTGAHDRIRTVKATTTATRRPAKKRAAGVRCDICGHEPKKQYGYGRACSKRMANVARVPALLSACSHVQRAARIRRNDKRRRWHGRPLDLRPVNRPQGGKMLGDHPIEVLLLATDLHASRDFYAQKLGLERSGRGAVPSGEARHGR